MSASVGLTPVGADQGVGPEESAAPLAPPSSYQRWLKPSIDRVAAAALLLVVLPAMALIALTIRIKLGRGVLYRQERVGRGGRHFVIFKFRTMAHDRRCTHLQLVGEDRRQNHKHPGDPRHTALGKLLRKSSLDELPQLLNVLRGDMSLVGPRPELPDVVATYSAWQHRRHAVKPGITGLWQVSPQRSGRMDQATALDLAYVGAVSFRTDITVLLRTVPAVFRRQTF
jgi:lipopolysaccharide/colanic/teichoic acid biosynthesis glycosyltransferase